MSLCLPYLKPICSEVKRNNSELPKFFQDACRIPSYAEATNKKYNALVNSGTCKYDDKNLGGIHYRFLGIFRLKDVTGGSEVLCKTRCSLWE